MASRGKQCVTELGDKTSEALCGTHHFHKVHLQLSTQPPEGGCSPFHRRDS